jgi:hypothetical protein
MSYFEQWMASNGAWDVTQEAVTCNTDSDGSKSVHCQRVRRFRYSGKRYLLQDVPPIFKTLIFFSSQSLEKGGIECNTVTRLAGRWKPYRFHAGDAFEGFPLRWPSKKAEPVDEWTLVRIIPRSEVLQSATIARRNRERDLLSLMHDCNVDEWTWVEHPDGSWRAHHSHTFGV